MKVVFEIPRKYILSANVSYHYQKKGYRAKKLREIGQSVANEMTEKERFEYCKIDIKVFSPTRRRLDPPNLSPTTKHLIDGMTDAKVWDDDDWKHINSVSFGYGGLSGEKDVYRFEFTITSLPIEERKVQL